MSKYYQCKLQRSIIGSLSLNSYFVQPDSTNASIVEETIRWVRIKNACVGNVLNNSWKVVEVYKLIGETTKVNDDGTPRIIVELL